MNPLNDGKLYEKVGKRYKPVRDIHAYDGLGQGCWLVRVDEGCTSISHVVNPDNAPREAAAKIAAEKVVKILSKASEARYVGEKDKWGVSRTPLSKRELKAIAAYNEVMGEEKTMYFQYPSLYDMANEIISELLKKEPENIQPHNPFAKKAKAKQNRSKKLEEPPF